MGMFAVSRDDPLHELVPYDVLPGEVDEADVLDVAKTKAMHVGDKGSIPAAMHHFATARGRTIVAVSSMGPFAMTYVNPADDPQMHAAKP